MRMRSERDFRLAYGEGSRARGSILLVVVRANGGPLTRLGLSVGRRAWRRAVRRNRVRRVFREAFRLAHPRLPVGLDVVMIPAEAEPRPALEATRAELERLVRKAHARFLEKHAAAGEARR